MIITIKHLNQEVNRLNELFNYATKPHWRTAKGEFKCNPNVFLLREVYGAFGLSQMASSGSSEKDITALFSKSILFLLIRNLIKGAEMYRQHQEK